MAWRFGRAGLVITDRRIEQRVHPRRGFGYGITPLVGTALRDVCHQFQQQPVRLHQNVSVCGGDGQDPRIQQVGQDLGAAGNFGQVVQREQLGRTTDGVVLAIQQRQRPRGVAVNELQDRFLLL